MALSYELISQFAKITNDKNAMNKESNVYGTIVKHGNANYVRLDGSELLTPYESTIAVEDGDRVLVAIKSHSATVTGSVTNPAASNKQLNETNEKIGKFNTVMSDKVETKDIEAINGYFRDILAITGKYEDLKSVNGDIEYLRTQYANMKEINAIDVEAINAEIEVIKNKVLESQEITTEDLEAVNAGFGNVTAYNATFTYVSAEVLKVVKAEIKELDANKVSTKELEAVNANIEHLNANVFDAETGNVKYANIEFSNIDMAAIEHLFSESGIIKDITTETGTITGELVGVTIKGDLIEGNTLKADKLVILGEDGLYYKLNVNAVGEATAKSDPKYQSGLDGSNIIAKTITADRISVSDLVAFGATIGGFRITEHSLYSGVKSSVKNTTRGIYFGDDGQFAVGDSSNFLRYYYDETDKVYKLEISAGIIKLGGTGKTLEETVEEIREEMTVNLVLESSRGTVFKNNQTSTIISVIIYRGSERITNMTALRAAMGNNVYLQWKWRREDDDSYGIISSSDSHLSEDGFKYTVTPSDVDSHVTFLCELINE